jgi:hypothetical protein
MTIQVTRIKQYYVAHKRTSSMLTWTGGTPVAALLAAALDGARGQSLVAWGSPHIPHCSMKQIITV